NPPQGTTVIPGRYKIVIEHKEFRDSTFVNVHGDPRVPLPAEQLKNKKAALKDFYKMVTKAAEAFEQLKSAKKTIGLVDEQIVNAPDSLKKDIEKYGKKMQDSIDKIMEIFLPPQNRKGIVRSDNTLNFH